jgi:hypothetical protein
MDFMTNEESRACACGGRSCMTPFIRNQHLQTKRHRKWRWNALCFQFLDITLPLKVKKEILREMKELVVVVG